MRTLMSQHAHVLGVLMHAWLLVQEQVGTGGSASEQQGTGIVLRRKKREDSSPSKAGDALAIAEMVQKLCQVI